MRYVNLRRFVKFPGKITGTIAVFIIIIAATEKRTTPSSITKKADEYFRTHLNVLVQDLNQLRDACRQKAGYSVLKRRFKETRTTYKKFAVLSEYFNVFETKFINGPALPRSEDGTPDIILPPQGLQAMEELVYDDRKIPDHSAIDTLVGLMLPVLERMNIEPDRQYKFRAELVWDAMRSAVVRISTLGITGFDSPVSLQSMSEAGITLTAVKTILQWFKEEHGSRLKDFENIERLLTKSNQYLGRKVSFNQFNRLEFITGCINPLYKAMVATRKKTGIGIPEGRSPINFDAESMFSKDFFQIDFFSPGQGYEVTDKRVELGRRLFSNPVLSGDNNRSCATCHLPEKAFTDGMAVPLATDNTTLLNRNTPTLWNSTLQTRQFYDSRTDILENQLKEVVHSTEEMQGSLAAAANELRKSPEFVKLFEEAYSGVREPVSAFNIANAISSYIRTLVSLDSRFDRYMRGDESRLNASEKRGFNLFMGKAKCGTCHFIPLFNGLVPPEFTETESEVLGVPASKEKKGAKLDSDPGKYEITRSVIHQYAFKTPTLRNINLTSPYMHNGVYNSLEEVMDFYNEGGGAGLKIAPENQTLPSDRLNLTKAEIADIIAFMNSLTDTSALK